MRNNFLFFLFFLFIALFNKGYSQIITDRPDQTESSIPLSKGHIQVETGIAFEKEQSNINSLIRFGILNGVELRLKNNFRESLDDIRSLEIPSKSGNIILSQVANISLED